MKHTLLALALCAALVLGGCGQQDRRPATGTNVAPGVTDHNGSIGTNGGGNNGITGNGTENGVVGSGTNGTGTDGTLGGTAGTSIYGARRGTNWRYRPTSWDQMVENGMVHDRDGFLLDGENTNW